MDNERRADQARMILDNPLFIEAMNALDESLRRQRMDVKATDTDGQTKLILAEQIRYKFEHYLRKAISDAQVQEMRLVQNKRTSFFSR